MKSFLSKLGVLLFGAMLAVGCHDYAEDIREVSGNLDKNTTEINASIASLDQEIKALEQKHAADKAVAETALANLRTSLEGKIKTDIEAAEAKLKAAYEAADAALAATAAADKAELQSKIDVAVAEAAGALAKVQTELDAAYKAADEAIKAAYQAKDVELDNAIKALQGQLDAHKSKVEGSLNTINATVSALDAAYKAADAALVEGYKGADALVKAELQGEIKTLEASLKAAYEAADKDLEAALKKQIEDLQNQLQDADAAMEATLQGNITAAIAKAAEELAAAKNELATGYAAADAALQAAIDENKTNIEKNAKAIEGLKAADEELKAADANLQAQITANDGDIENLNLAVEAEAEARAKAITELNEYLNGKVEDLTDLIDVNKRAIEAEAEARANADNELQDQLADAVKAHDEAVAKLQDADKALQAAIDNNAGDIAELKIKVATLESQVAALQAWQVTAQSAIDKNASDIDVLKSDMQLLDAAYKAADEALELADKELQKNIDNLSDALEDYKTEAANTFATKKELADAKDALDAKINGVESELSANITAVNGRVDELTGFVNDQIAAVNETIKAETDARVEAINGVTDLINGLTTTVANNKTELEGKITDLKTELEGKIAAVQSNLDNAIEAERTARENAISAINIEVDGLEERIKSLETSRATITLVLDAATQNITNLQTGLGLVEGRLDKVETDLTELTARVNELFENIQSVVYRPTHSDGKARVEYAKLGNLILEGNSDIVYKVYPTKYAKTIVDAFNAQPEKQIELTYDIASVINTKSGSNYSLDVVAVALTEKEGELKVTYKASNLDGDQKVFYADDADLSYSASLVLDHKAQNFSTEYTNLVAEKLSDATVYEFKLYQGANEAADKKYEIEYPAVGDSFTQTILAGLEPKFVTDGASPLSVDDFFALYPLARDEYRVEKVDIKKSEEIFVTDEDENGYVTVALAADKVASDNVGESCEVKYGYTFYGTTLNATGVVNVTDFLWTLAVAKNDNSVKYPLELVYTDNDSVEVLPDFEISFVKGNESKTEGQLKEAGYLIRVDYLDVKTEVTTAKGGATADLFVVAPMTETKAPVTVTLAQENNLNKAVAANVGTIFNVEYGFNYVVGADEVIATETIDADVMIQKTRYSFDITVGELEWTYLLDADADKTGNSYCSRELAYAVDATEIVATKCPADQDIEDVFADASMIKSIDVNGTLYEGTELANSPVTFSDAVAADSKVNVDLTGLAWDQTYEVTAVFERESAIVTVNLTASTKNRNTAPIEINLGDVTKTYTANYQLAHTAETQLSLGLNDALVANDNLGAVASVDDALLDKILDGAVATEFAVVADATHSYTEDKEIMTGLKPADGFKAVTYGFHYKNLHNNLKYVSGDLMAKSYDYSMTFKTWYGQVIVAKFEFNFADPKYDYKHVYHRVDGSDETGYYSNVNPDYAYDNTEGKLMYFNVEQVKLNGAFDVVADDVVLTEDQIKDLGIVRRFEIKEKEHPGISFYDAEQTIISYNGKLDYVTVNGYLKVENYDNKTDIYTYYPIDNTIFTGAYSTYQVRKYDPLNEVTILEGMKEQKILITKNEVYEFFVLDNFSILDKLNPANQLINPNPLDGANAWVIGGVDNNISKDMSVATLYGLKATYEIVVTDPTTGAPKGISVQPENGKIVIDNTVQITFEKPVTIQARVIIEYPQGRKISPFVTYVFCDK